MSRDLASEIVRYVQPRDRPSPLALRVMRAARGPDEIQMRITCPVEHGKRVLKVAHFQGPAYFGVLSEEVQVELNYNSDKSGMESVAALIDGAHEANIEQGPDRWLQVVTTENEDLILAHWPIPRHRDQRHVRMENIMRAIQTLVTE